MAGDLSPAARVKLADLAGLLEKVHRANNLLEQYASGKAGADQFLVPLSRQLAQLKLLFMGAGHDAMSQLAGSMEMAARRGLSPTAKVRVLREGVGSLKFQVELAQRAIISEGQTPERKAAVADDAPSEPH